MNTSFKRLLAIVVIAGLTASQVSAAGKDGLLGFGGFSLLKKVNETASEPSWKESAVNGLKTAGNAVANGANYSYNTVASHPYITAGIATAAALSGAAYYKGYLEKPVNYVKTKASFVKAKAKSFKNTVKAKIKAHPGISITAALAALYGAAYKFKDRIQNTLTLENAHALKDKIANGASWLADKGSYVTSKCNNKYGYAGATITALLGGGYLLGGGNKLSSVIGKENSAQKAIDLLKKRKPADKKAVLRLIPGQKQQVNSYYNSLQKNCLTAAQQTLQKIENELLKK